MLGARNGTNADVSLAILYPDGREVVHDEGRFIWDPYLDHTFEAAGDYIAAITLTRMPAGGQSRSDLNYQIAIRAQPVSFGLCFRWAHVEEVPANSPCGAIFCRLELRCDFPRWLVVRRAGNEGTLRERCSSGDYRLPVKISSTTEPGVYDLGVNDNSGTLAPLKFVVGDLPESS